jgi:hypothetical protein
MSYGVELTHNDISRSVKDNDVGGRGVLLLAPNHLTIGLSLRPASAQQNG